MKAFLNKTRLNIIKFLLTDDEKYMLIRSVEHRVENLQRIRINERWVNAEEMLQDINDLNQLKKIFSTRYWG